jgi:uncharacterized membrane protein
MEEKVTRPANQGFERNTLLILAAILAVGTFLRLFRLGHAELWTDEIATAAWYLVGGITDLNGMIRYWQATTYNSPFIAFVAFGAIKLLGASEFNLRLPFAVAGILCLPMMFLLGRKMFKDDSLALWLTGLTALSPFWIHYSQDARFYPFYLLITLLSVYVYLEVRRHRSSWGWEVAFVVVNALGFSIHQFYLILWSFFTLWFAWDRFKHPRDVPYPWRRWIVMNGVILLVISPLLIDFIGRILSTSTGFPPERALSPANIIHPIFAFYAGFAYGPPLLVLKMNPSVRAIIPYWPWLALAAAAFGVPLLYHLRRIHRDPEAFLYLLIPYYFLAMAVGSIVGHVPLNARYLAPVALPLLVLLAHSYHHDLKNKFKVIGLVLLAVVWGVGLYNHYYDDAYGRAPVRSLLAWIQREGIQRVIFYRTAYNRDGIRLYSKSLPIEIQEADNPEYLRRLSNEYPDAVIFHEHPRLGGLPGGLDDVSTLLQGYQRQPQPFPHFGMYRRQAAVADTTGGP